MYRYASIEKIVEHKKSENCENYAAKIMTISTSHCDAKLPTQSSSSSSSSASPTAHRSQSHLGAGCVSPQQHGGKNVECRKPVLGSLLSFIVWSALGDSSPVPGKRDGALSWKEMKARICTSGKLLCL